MPKTKVNAFHLELPDSISNEPEKAKPSTAAVKIQDTSQTTDPMRSDKSAGIPLQQEEQKVPGLEAIQEKFDKLKDDYDNLKKELIKLTEELKDTKQTIRDTSNEERKKTVEILGIFISIFTFVSAEIQIFKDPPPLLACAGFTLILLGSLLLFNIFLNHIISNKDENLELNLKRRGVKLSLLFVVLIGIGLFLIAKSPEKLPSTENSNDLIDYKVNENENKITDLEDKFQNLNDRLIELNSNQDILEKDIQNNHNSK